MSLPMTFAIGIAIGLVMVVPVGPVNLLTVSRTLRFGVLPGFVAGLGGMAADVVFAIVSAFGVSAVTDFVSGHKAPLQWLGGVLLLVMGVTAMRSHPHLDRVSDRGGGRGLVGGFLAAFLMTITNPGAAFGMLALFGSFVDPDTLQENAWNAPTIVAGIACGSTLWWLGLATAVGRVRERMTDDWLAGLNRAAGIVLVLFGLALLAGTALGYDLV